jgi:hypothetical protein
LEPILGQIIGPILERATGGVGSQSRLKKHKVKKIMGSFEYWALSDVMAHFEPKKNSNIRKGKKCPGVLRGPLFCYDNSCFLWFSTFIIDLSWFTGSGRKFKQIGNLYHQLPLKSKLCKINKMFSVIIS